MPKAFSAGQQGYSINLTKFITAQAPISITDTMNIVRRIKRFLDTT